MIPQIKKENSPRGQAGVGLNNNFWLADLYDAATTSFLSVVVGNS